MTMPTERTRNLLQAGAFLKENRADESLPDRVREEANRLLRHYPTVSEFHLLAQIEAKSAGWSDLLTPKFNADWVATYRFGAHT